MSDPAFAALPPYSKDYLQTIAKAFSEKNASFLAAQGEPNYAKRVRARTSEGEFLALLYRIGEYAQELPYKDGPPLTLDAAKVANIQFLGWDERGPVIEVRAQITYQSGKTEPCILCVLWKLDPPKILGRDL